MAHVSALLVTLFIKYSFLHVKVNPGGAIKILIAPPDLEVPFYSSSGLTCLAAMGPKKNVKHSHPLVRFRTKAHCGSNGKPVRKARGRGRPYLGGNKAACNRRALTKNERMAGQRALFRFQSKTYGLTFSNAVGIESKEQLHAYMQNLLGVHFCCVSRELHENGVQHFHVSGRCDGKLDITDCHYFDFTDGDSFINHPNIVKGGPAWLSYVMKAHDFISTYPSKPNIMADALACPSTERALDHIMQHDAGSYVKFGINIERNLQRHYTRLTRTHVPRWYGPYPAGRYPPDWNPSTHSLHLYGPPGSGKTCFAQHLLREYYGDCEYVKAHIEALKSLTFTKPFVFDEVMLLCHDAATSREITDVVSGGVIHARYNAITIPPGIARVFVSNQRWVFKNPDDSVYGRRLVQYEMPFSCPIEEWRLYNPPADIRPPPRPPTPEQPPPPPPGSPGPDHRSPPPPPDDGMIDEPDDEPSTFTRMHSWRSIGQRWEQDAEGFMYRPRPSRNPDIPAIGAAPVPMSPMVPVPLTPLAIRLWGDPSPASPVPVTPHWSPGWSPMLPYDDLFDMDVDPFLEEETLVHRADM